MKSQQTQINNQTNFETNLQWNPLLIQTDYQSFTQIKCSNNQLSTLSCINKKCKQYAFLCQNKQCPCQKQHPNCLLVKNQTIHNNLLSKTISTQPLQKSILQSIDSMIDSLSDFRDKIQIRLRNIKITSLDNQQKQFFQKFKSANVSNVKGCHLWSICFQSQYEEIIQAKFNKSIQKIHNSLTQFNEQKQILYDKINKELKIFQNNQKQDFIFGKSQILKQEAQLSILEQFFDYRKIKKATLLYKASQNGFSVQKFHQLCNGQISTLVLCETQTHCKIGGYTPLPWLGLVGRYSTDDSNASFIFSLTNKDKFRISQNTTALFHYQDNSFAFSFGSGADFKISNYANNNNNSRTNINVTYKNLKYNQSSNESLERFCGNKSSYFKVNEWQVWKIKFEQQQDSDNNSEQKD